MKAHCMQWLTAFTLAAIVLGPGLVEAQIHDRDCIPFNTDRLELERSDGDFILVDGTHRIRNLVSSRRLANKALRIFRHYEIDRHCFVGRPNPSLHYLLAGGEAPAGEFDREDCNRFDPG